MGASGDEDLVRVAFADVAEWSEELWLLLVLILGNWLGGRKPGFACPGWIEIELELEKVIRVFWS